LNHIKKNYILPMRVEFSRTGFCERVQIWRLMVRATKSFKKMYIELWEGAYHQEISSTIRGRVQSLDDHIRNKEVHVRDQLSANILKIGPIIEQVRMLVYWFIDWTIWLNKNKLYNSALWFGLYIKKIIYIYYIYIYIY
jgi:hypothetical protein